ncbi:MAG: HEPN domain containing protein [Candidatus Methanohalarchaeum thermophilum]|uniref:HEPN domain containing protein n=1 Tax=Methanohalarchaeum thermophilum TaxID=1903181 RepID=A0A1Q6DSV6_METT1|nr:MAG: HEPN domain containing protein [Candidatus Methanohalarchaeum thermophilum]
MKLFYRFIDTSETTLKNPLAFRPMGVCQDAIEQAASAGIAASNQKIPRDHPAKIKSFVESLNIGEELRNSLFKWLRKRSNSQYVDIRGDEINVPHEMFNQSDAEEIIKDAEKTIEKVREEIKI